MAQIIIRLVGDDLLCLDGSAVTRKPLSSDGLARLKGWADAYSRAVQARQPDTLMVIGQEIAALLNQGDGWLDGCLGRPGPVSLEIGADLNGGEAAQLLLNVPWELLAPGGRFLAADHRPFLVARRLGQAEPHEAPEYGDLATLFMAAEVEGPHVLDYEREEVAFLNAGRGLNAHLVIEESGSAAGLALRLKKSRRWEALHLTCHGDLGRTGPYLALETEEGALDPVDADRLCTLLGDENQMPRLVFLSACRTAERPGASATSFVQALITAGVANAVGWDGSVLDSEAIHFTEPFYRELAGGRSVTYAAAVARHAVLAANGAHWHLARVWLGPRGGGPLCMPGNRTRPVHRNAADKVFLDKAKGRVPVATAEQFVGRRRSIQAAMRAWNNGTAGILIQGMGNLGKSSLAERIASRLDNHRTLVVFERYDAHTVFQTLVDALPEDQQLAINREYETEIINNPAALKLVLQMLLKGPFSGHGGSRPILLIIDDLERILADPKPGEQATPFKTPADGAVIAAVIAAFSHAGRETASRLLITSRYRFALTGAQGDDLASRLSMIALPPMDDVQRTKQMRTAARLNGRLRMPGADLELDGLERRIRAAAGGNPGLQEILTRPLLTIRDRAAGQDAATKAVLAVESYLNGGSVPVDDSAAQEFFKRVSLEAFKAMLTPTEQVQLRAATLFPVAVPLNILELAGRAAGIADPGPAVERLQGLGLIDRYPGPDDRPDGAVNPLARPLVTALSVDEQKLLAAQVVGELYNAWSNDDGQLSATAQAAALADLALRAEGPPDIIQASVSAGGRYLFDAAHQAEPVLQMVQNAVGLLDQSGTPPGLSLLRLGAECAERLGQGPDQDAFLARAVTMTGVDPHSAATILYDRGVRLIQTGDVEGAEGLLREASERFGQLGDVRSRAVTMGQIADILEARGQTDEALRIHIDERLPVAHQLQDLESRAHIRFCCAQIRIQRGGLQSGEAATIVEEVKESFDLNQQIGRADGIAFVGFLFGQILAGAGALEAALHVFDQAADAFAILGHTQQVEQIRNIQEAIRKAAE